MKERVDAVLKAHWQQMVHDAYFYRRMSLKNLYLDADIVLDPGKNH
jgi:hypothetical protein